MLPLLLLYGILILPSVAALDTVGSESSDQSPCFVPETSLVARKLIVPQYSVASIKSCEHDCQNMASCSAYYYNELIEQCALLGDHLMNQQYCRQGKPPTVYVKCEKTTTVDSTTDTEVDTTTAHSTTSPTTTPKIDVLPLAPEYFVELKSKYAASSDRQAFCIESMCYLMESQIGKLSIPILSLGKILGTGSIKAVREQCPIGSKHLVPLGFTYDQSMMSYKHDFTGAGFQQGYVSTTYGSCGAKKQINLLVRNSDKHNLYTDYTAVLGYGRPGVTYGVFYTW